MTKLKYKIKIPDGAESTCERSDSTVNLMLYEVDVFDILEKVELKPDKKRKFYFKDGQYIKKGDVIFTEGFVNQHTMLADQAGILDIKADSCRILGQKRHIERRFNFKGHVTKVIPGRSIILELESYEIKLPFYINRSVKYTELEYLGSKLEFKIEKIKAHSLDQLTLIVNDNLYTDELAKISALGIKRLIVNSINIDNYENLKKEIDKFESIAAFGFGDLISKNIEHIDTSYGMIWGNRRCYFSNNVGIVNTPKVYQHPFWGITSNSIYINGHIGHLEYNGKSIEIYLKNLRS